MKSGKSAMIIAATLLLAVSIQGFFSTTRAQAVTQFTSTTEFSIPENNGNIIFAYNGTYESATLESNAWTFVNLRLNYSGGGVNVTISAQNCTINVTYCRFTNFGELPSATLRYFASGSGTQTIKFNHQMERAEWMPTYRTYNGYFYLVKGRDWTETSNGALVVTGAPPRSNVTVSYRVFADYLGRGGDTSNQSIFQQHSVAIATGVGLASIIALAVTIRTIIVQRRRNDSEFGVSNEFT